MDSKVKPALQHVIFVIFPVVVNQARKTHVIVVTVFANLMFHS